MFSFCAHSVVRAGCTSPIFAAIAWLPRAIWRPTKSRSTSLPVIAGTTDTAVPLIANVASFGAVSMGVSCAPSATLSLAGSLCRTSFDLSICVSSVGATCSGERSSAVPLTFTTTGAARTARASAGSARDVLRVHRGGRGADREAPRVALAPTERGEYLLLGLRPLDADARPGRDLHDLGPDEAEPTVDEALAGLGHPRVEDGVEAGRVDVDDERDVVGTEPPEHRPPELVEGVVAPARLPRRAHARGRVDVEVERGRVDRKLGRAGAHAHGGAVELGGALLDRPERLLLGHPAHVDVTDHDALQHVAVAGDALRQRERHEEQQCDCHPEQDQREALVAPGALERRSARGFERWQGRPGRAADGGLSTLKGRRNYLVGGPRSRSGLNRTPWSGPSTLPPSRMEVPHGRREPDPECRGPARHDAPLARASTCRAAGWRPSTRATPRPWPGCAAGSTTRRGASSSARPATPRRPGRPSTAPVSRSRPVTPGSSTRC